MVWMAWLEFVSDSPRWSRCWMKNRAGCWLRLKAKRGGAAASRRYPKPPGCPAKWSGKDCGSWSNHPRIRTDASGVQAEDARAPDRKIRHWSRIWRGWSNRLRAAIRSPAGCAGPARACGNWPQNWSAWDMQWAIRWSRNCFTKWGTVCKRTARRKKATAILIATRSSSIFTPGYSNAWACGSQWFQWTPKRRVCCRSTKGVHYELNRTLQLRERWWQAHRDRLSGAGLKPVRAATFQNVVVSVGRKVPGETWGRWVSKRRAQANPPMTRR